MSDAIKTVKVRIPDYQGVPYTIAIPEIVYVKSSANFPEPIEGSSIIQLENKHYILMNDVIMPSGTSFYLNKNVKISSNNYAGAKFIFYGNSPPLFQDKGGVTQVESFTMEGVVLEVFDTFPVPPYSNQIIFQTWTVGDGPRIALRDCHIRGGNLWNLNGKNVDIDNCIFSEQFQGINALATIDSFTITNCVFQDWQNQPDTIMINVGSSDNLHISDNIFYPQSNETILDLTEITGVQSVMVSSNQFHILGASTGSLLTPTSKTQKDPECIFVGNSNIADSTVIGQFEFDLNTQATHIVNGALVRLTANYFGDDSGFERMTITGSGILTHIGNAPRTLKVTGMLQFSNPAQNSVKIKLFKNGVNTGVSTRITSIASETLFLTGVVDVEKDDYLELIVEAQGTFDVFSERCSILLFK